MLINLCLYCIVKEKYMLGNLCGVKTLIATKITFTPIKITLTSMWVRCDTTAMDFEIEILFT